MKLITLMPVFLCLLIVVDYCQSFPFFLASLIPSAINLVKKIGKRDADFQRYVDLKRRDLDLDELMSRLSEY
uniref:Putative NDBP n=1 Tax=Superstitionia donensis TaxID=311983 RepID=A0A1V1WBM3_9SCOR